MVGGQKPKGKVIMNLVSYLIIYMKDLKIFIPLDLFLDLYSNEIIITTDTCLHRTIYHSTIYVTGRTTHIPKMYEMPRLSVFQSEIKPILARGGEKSSQFLQLKLGLRTLAEPPQP